MIGAGVAVNEKFIINTADQDLAAMESAVLALDEMPDVFICSNDFVAIDFIHILRKNNIDFLRKVKILGFDDSHESKVFYPSISSIHIHAHSMGQTALNLLLTRMQNPSMEFRTMYVATDLVLRESTEF
jgi:LacI family transcriptional regulator